MKLNINRIYINIIKFILLWSPLITGIVVVKEIIIEKQNLVNIFSSDPRLAIMYILSMLNLLILFLIKSFDVHLQTNQNYVLINMIFIILSQIIIMNVVYLTLFSILLYVFIKMMKMPLKQLIRNISFKNIFRNGKMGLVVFSSYILCTSAVLNI